MSTDAELNVDNLITRLLNGKTVIKKKRLNINISRT